MTQEAVGAIRTIGGTIDEMNGISTTIASAVEEQAATAHEITRSTQSAARGTNELSGLPHTGAVIDLREVERLERMLAFLAGEVERRTSCAGEQTPRLLLVVDGWDSLVWPP